LEDDLVESVRTTSEGLEDYEDVGAVEKVGMTNKGLGDWRIG
jgi:hypothetical protein